ncbi:MAG: HpcH/HpaI aldolase/citrate lyase family protein, partial [Sphingomonadaceae bacterium]
MTPQFRPRRSCLFMPGSKPRALEKARSLPADMLIFDLEDSVAPDSKQEARRAVEALLQQGGFGRCEAVVRINGLDTAWGEGDLAAAIKAGAGGVLVPKINRPADIISLQSAMDSAGAAPDLPLWIMVETPLCVLEIANIAACAPQTRLAGFVIGTND